MNNADYISKMMDILGDKTKFECLEGCDVHDRTGQNERSLQTYLLRQRKAGEISSEVYRRVRPTRSVRPRMYGLPKVHKPKPIPLRPILSVAGSTEHELQLRRSTRPFLLLQLRINLNRPQLSSRATSLSNLMPASTALDSPAHLSTPGQPFDDNEPAPRRKRFCRGHQAASVLARGSGGLVCAGRGPIQVAAHNGQNNKIYACRRLANEGICRGGARPAAFSPSDSAVHNSKGSLDSSEVGLRVVKIATTSVYR